MGLDRLLSLILLRVTYLGLDDFYGVGVAVPIPYITVSALQVRKGELAGTLPISYALA